MNHSKICILTTFVVSFLLSGTFSHAFEGEKTFTPTDCFSILWPHEKSELQPDPSLVFGRLPNGLRYVLMENHEPQKRVGLYLNIQAGSINETDEQRGLAHYLEHMLFNGSTHFKPGELVEYFQSIGMDFGGDTNAHTTYDETVYKIILPSGDEKEIDRGLLVLADYARGALLLDSEINRERGVILAEKRTRDSASYRVQVESSKFALKGTKLPLRKPIGTLNILKNADHDLLKEFYDSWYRPNNMILVMVGDFQPSTVESIIKKHFGNLQGSGPEPVCPDYGRLQRSGRNIFYFYEPELGVTNISIESLWQQPQVDDSFSLQAKEIREYIVSRLINYRLEQLMEAVDVPFTESRFYAGDVLGFIGYSGIFAKTSPEKWKEALKSIESTLRQALEYGFAEDELTIVKKELISQLTAEVLRTSTRDSKQLARNIIRGLNENRVVQSPKQELELYGKYIEKLKLAEVESTLKRLWSNDNLFVEMTGNVKLGEEPERRIETLYTEATKSEVRRWEGGKQVHFPYLSHNDIADKSFTTQPLKKIEGERFLFANGVVVNTKQTNFKKDHIEIRIDIDGGRLAEPQSGMAMLAEEVVKESGSGRLRKTELERVLAGSTVSYDFQVKRASFIWRGNALKKDMELLFQVMQTVVVDPGFRKEVYESAKESYKQSYQRLERDIKGGMRFYVKRFLAGGHPSFGWPLWKDFSTINFLPLQNWIFEELHSGRLEISIVGDFDRATLVELCKKYFGGLEVRDGGKQSVDKITFPEGKMVNKSVNSSIDKSLVVLAWPTTDFWDISRTRRLNMLAKIFDDRLRLVIREKLGAAYSPVVYSFSSRHFNDYGFLIAQMVVEPGKVDMIREAVLVIGTSLQKEGISEDELKRAKAPTLTSLRDMVRTNGYWMNSVLARSYAHPEQLQWSQTILPDYEVIKSEEINALAQQYLLPERVATAIIQPE